MYGNNTKLRLFADDTSDLHWMMINKLTINVRCMLNQRLL